MGLEPTSGPGLIFSTLPKVFAALPFGWVFGALFFLGLMARAICRTSAHSKCWSPA
jgi:NSS family neurotransmitter:Na+ symporter